MTPLIERLSQALAPDYRVEQTIEFGGMGIILVAQDVVLGRRVAIKVLRPEFASGRAAERFLREARLLASLSHRSIVAVHRAGEIDGLPYYVMDFVEGETLAQRLERGPLALHDALRMADALLDGLDDVHRAGIIHRDIKPANVFLLEERTLLVDFGIAKTDIPESETTASTLYAGTPGYMAPEQATGGNVDARTDIYNVGMLLYEAITRRRWKPTDDPGQANWSGVRPSLSAVLQRALAWSPRDRWASARAFREALRTLPPEKTTGPLPIPRPRRLAAIMFTDIAGYTPLMQLEESAALRARARHRAALATTIPNHGGELVQFLGDGSLTVFPSAVEAVHAAIEILHALAEDVPLPVRIGIHQGEIAYDDQGILGDSVNIAARLQALSLPGGILVSDKVHDELKNHADLRSAPLGEVRLKGVSRPITVHAITAPGIRVPRPDEIGVIQGSHPGVEHEPASANPLDAVGGLPQPHRVEHAGRARGAVEPGPSRRGTIYKNPWTIALAIMVVALAGIALWTILTPARSDKRIAIVFRPAQMDSAAGAHAEADTNMLIDILNQVLGIRVINPTSVFSLRPSTAAEPDVASIGSILDVDYVLDGLMTRHGDSLRLNLQLHTMSGEQNAQWRQSVTRPLSDRCTGNANLHNIARWVAEAVRVDASRLREPDCASRDTTAWDLLDQGNKLWLKRTEGSLGRALEFYERALARDPGFSRAHIGIANVYLLLGAFEYGLVPPDTAYRKALNAAQQAIALDSTARAYTALASVRMNYDWNWAESESLFKHASMLSPGYAEAHHWYSLLLSCLRRHDEAFRELQQARELDPLNPIMHTAFGRYYYLRHNFPEAINSYKQVLIEHPNFVIAHIALGQVEVMNSNIESGISRYNTASRLLGRPTATLIGLLGHAYAKAGRIADANAMLDTLRTRQAAGEYIPPEYRTIIYIGLGDLTSALFWLEEAYENKSNAMAYLKVEPIVDPLREHPQFKDLLRRLNLD